MQTKIINAHTHSKHYCEIIGEPIISQTVKNRMHNYVNIAKAMFEKGATSNGRTLNFTFVAKKSKLIAIGQNNYNRIINYVPLIKTNYRKFGEDTYVSSLHSELSAVLRLGQEDCSDLDFYNIRIDKNKHCKNSAPCLNCLRTLNIVGFKHLYYYDDQMNMKQL